MRLLKINILLIISILLSLSCSNNKLEIGGYQKFIIGELTEETKEQNNRIQKVIDIQISELNTTPNYKRSMADLTETINKLQKEILNNDSLTQLNVLSIKNTLLNKFSIYKSGRYNWFLDTNTYDFSTCNPKDTSIINRSLIKYEQVINHINLNNKLNQLLLLQTNVYVREQWIGRYNLTSYQCFNRPIVMTHFENKIFYQDEHATISPGMFLLDDYVPINIFNENTSDFIKVNGENKTFTNPVTLQASSVKGVHSVKGVIMVKQKGELIPKPFEFRYIVE